MAKQNKAQETIIEENLVEKEVNTVEEIETVIEEDIKEDIIIEDNTPEVIEDTIIVEDTPVKENTIIADQEAGLLSSSVFDEEKNTNKVRKIIQKRPSHYSLLMEDGRQVVIHKTLFDKSTMTVKENK